MKLYPFEIEKMISSYQTSSEIITAIVEIATEQEDVDRIWNSPTSQEYKAIVCRATELNKQNGSGELYWGVQQINIK